jgi:hypothetical protein
VSVAQGAAPRSAPAERVPTGPSVARTRLLACALACVQRAYELALVEPWCLEAGELVEMAEDMLACAALLTDDRWLRHPGAERALQEVEGAVQGYLVDGP